jgi:hypothetical protein
MVRNSWKPSVRSAPMAKPMLIFANARTVVGMAE